MTLNKSTYKSTKIVATLGPASDSKEMIEKLFSAGMNVARLNFSHGDHEYFKGLIKNIREVSSSIAILLDTKGPEIRTGKIESKELALKEGQIMTLSCSKGYCTGEEITFSYPKIEKLMVGETVSFDDGLIKSEIVSNSGGVCKIKILHDAVLESNKTVSFKNHNAEIEFLSDKDMKDIMFGIEQGVDFIAASFVREASEVKQLKDLMKEHNSEIRIISKIEHSKAVENIHEIINISDGIMVARGDLGVEVELEEVPYLQKQIIERCNEIGRPVIVATQMLESMKNSPRPTRAEVTDVASAILQGADAVMLSGETASGKYPVQAVEMMTSIAKRHDPMVRKDTNQMFQYPDELMQYLIPIVITQSAVQVANAVNAKAIFIPTESGYTARKVARFRPQKQLFAITKNETVFRQLQLSWGIKPILHPTEHASNIECLRELTEQVSKEGIVEAEDKIVAVFGNVVHKKGNSNTLKVYEVKEILQNK